MAATKVNDTTPALGSISGRPTKTDPIQDGVAAPFIQRHPADVIGVLHSWNRLRLQGSLRSLYHPSVMQYYLRQAGVLWKDFKTFATGLAYRREDNGLPWIADVPRAQVLLDEPHRTDWPALLRPLIEQCHPLAAEITRPIEHDYYWTAAESEYATDKQNR